MVKGDADNRKFRQVRRKKRKGFNVACTSNTKISKHKDDENGGEELVVVENEVTVDVAATSKTQVSTSLVGDDAADDGQWVDIPDEQTVSKKKVKNIVVGGEEKKLIGYRFFDCGILSFVFNKMICPDCKKSNVTLKEDTKQGLAFKYSIVCSGIDCCWSYSFFSCIRAKKNSSKFTRTFDINSRIIYSLRRLGKGYAGLKAFLYLMNHPPPMSEKSYRDTNKKICDSVQIIADKSMVAAAKEVSGIEGSANDGYCRTAISVDGTWQRRGFSSLNGAVAGISLVNGKVLDVAIMSRHCQGCVSINTSSVTNDELLRLRAEHDCTISHIGSAPAMEAKGAELIFNRSIKKHHIVYNGYLGDGDSKGFEKVKNIYPDEPVTKYECVGHVQKRVGNRLRKLKKMSKA